MATDTFEIGSRDLTEETANSIELSVRRQLAATTATFNVFYNHIVDYIFQRARGDLFNETTDALVGICPPGNECAAVFVFSQQDASFRGFEAELAWTAFDTAQYPVKVRIFSDYVRATLDNGGDVPRLPPLRYGFELRQNSDAWHAFLRTTVAANQNNPGLNETKTKGYTRVDAGVNFHFAGQGLQHNIFVKANNLLNEKIRLATSFQRNIAPEAGRSLVIGYRGEF